MRVRSILAIVLSAALQNAGYSQEFQRLTIGSQAPQLKVEHWFSDGNGKYKPVKTFEKDKIYVIEFWATWCGPCIMTMPHLVDIQNRFADKNVQIISISDESLATVEEFLGRKVSGDEEQTYRKLTSAYCLTTDPDGSSHRDYMFAAQQDGIPTSFIVGKSGQIEWIGHPAVIEDTLQKVVDGTWDRDAYKKEMELETKRIEVIQMLTSKTSRFAKSGEITEGVAMLENALKEHADDETLVSQIQSLRLRLKTAGAFLKLKAGKVDEANTELAKLFDTFTDDEKAQIMIVKCKLLTSLYADTMKQEQYLASSLLELQSMKSVSEDELHGVLFNVLHSLDEQKNLHPSIVEASFRGCEKLLADDDFFELNKLDTYCQFAVLKGDRAAAIQAVRKAMSKNRQELQPRLEGMLKDLEPSAKK
jgi:thiol-disulfide isomerase/thioredoxin